MNILENFKDLFLEIWQQGIAGVNFTQIGLAIPLLLLYEVSIWSVKIIEKKIKEKEHA